MAADVEGAGAAAVAEPLNKSGKRHVVQLTDKVEVAAAGVVAAAEQHLRRRHVAERNPSFLAEVNALEAAPGDEKFFHQTAVELAHKVAVQRLRRCGRRRDGCGTAPPRS